MWLGNGRCAACAGVDAHRIDAAALAHFSQRVHCLASQEMTASSAPAYVLTVPTELLASGRSWRSLNLALTVGFGVRVRGVSLCRLSDMLLGPILGPDRGVWRSPCVCGLACTLSKGAACVRPIERPRLLDCVVVSCGRQQ